MTTILRAGTLALALLSLVAVAATAAEPLRPYLVRDITPGTYPWFHDIEFYSASLGEVVFFGVMSPNAGLWRTDGTAAGTHRISDDVADARMNTYSLVKWNGSIYYPVTTKYGTWLYRTDGTTPGTNQVARISESWWGGAPCGDGKLCFATHGNRISVTDGTPAGTAELVRTAITETFTPRWMTALGRRVFFNGYDTTSGACRDVHAGVAGQKRICGELWTSDGTVAGTRLFKDLMPGSAAGGPEHLFVSSDGKLYFAAADPARPIGSMPWVSDGTPEGTRMLPATLSDWAASPWFYEVEGRVHFPTSDGDLFVTDGTPQGTRSIRAPFGDADSIVTPVMRINGRTLIHVHHLNRRPELFSWDGTTPVKIADIPYGFRALGILPATGQAWFIANDTEIWSSDGTPAGTGRRFIPETTGGSAFWLAATPTRLYFARSDNVYVTDGTLAGTRQVDLTVQLPNSTYISDGKVVNGKYYFTGAEKLGTSDGTYAGTVLFPAGTRDPFAHEGITYLSGPTGYWKTDGTLEGTVRLRDWLGVEAPQPPAFIGSRAVFADVYPVGRVVSRDPDGTLHDLGIRDRDYSPFVSTAGGVAFFAGTSPMRLFFTDGTAAGTRMVASDFQPRSELVPLGAKAVFGAKTTGEQRVRLWVTDFTAEGTKPIKEFPGTLSGETVKPLFTWRNLSIFRFGDTGMVWRSDGTADGTFPLMSVATSHVVADGDRELVFVRATFPGYEVWTSDGTIAGTSRRDSYPESQLAGTPFVMSSGGVGVIYKLGDEFHVRNHRTKIDSFIDVRDPWRITGLTGNGNTLFFGYDRGNVGSELFAARLDGPPPPSAPSAIRVDYTGVAHTPTGLGAVFRVTLEHAGVDAPTVIASTADGTLTAARDYVPFSSTIVFEREQPVTLVVPLRDTVANGTLSIVLSSPGNATIAQGIATAHVSVGGRRRIVGR